MGSGGHGAWWWLRVLIVAAPALVGAALLFHGPPLAQPASYHNFADQRLLLGVPHSLNVLSNLPFLLVGALGLRFVLRRASVGPDRAFLTRPEIAPYVVFFFGVGLTAFGSSHYHLQPTNARLFWDRLPMSLAFTGLFAAILGERLGVRIGVWALAPLVLAGLGSVLYWHLTEERGAGDLRAYYLVQFYPALGMPLLLLLFPPRYSGTPWLFAALGWYVAAKVLEHPGDRPVFEAGHIVSGHTLKHLTAAYGTYAILCMLQSRRPVFSRRP